VTSIKGEHNFMTIITTTVSLDGYNEVRDGKPNHQQIETVNQYRLDVLEKALAKAHDERADLLCLPGGYFYYAPSKPITNPLATSEPGLVRLIEAIMDLAKNYQLAIAVGLDLAKKNQTVDNAKDVRAGTLPSYALCWSPSDRDLHCWNQRSVTSSDQFDCPETFCNASHTMQVRRSQVEILMCGEAFNSKIRDAITRRHEKPLALVDLAHTLAGFRVTYSLKEIAEYGIHALCCGHADKRGAIKYYYAPQVGRRSSSQPDFTCGPTPRLEGKVWPI
jgi:hypothetical protein